MKKEKSIQADINNKLALSDIISYIGKDYSQDPMQKARWLSALRASKQALEAMRDAGDMLPEKKNTMCQSVNLQSDCDIHNKAIDLCQPIVAKLKKEIEEWIKDFNTLAKERDSLKAQPKPLSKQRIEEVIRRSRAGQALFLEVTGEILEDAYKLFAEALYKESR